MYTIKENSPIVQIIINNKSCHSHFVAKLISFIFYSSKSANEETFRKCLINITEKQRL